jgi:hypothetical protein
MWIIILIYNKLDLFHVKTLSNLLLSGPPHPPQLQIPVLTMKPFVGMQWEELGSTLNHQQNPKYIDPFGITRK